MAFVKAELAPTGHYRASHDPLRCISVVAQAYPDRPRSDEVSPWYKVMGGVDFFEPRLVAEMVGDISLYVIQA